MPTNTDDVRVLLIALGEHAVPALALIDGAWRSYCDMLPLPVVPKQIVLPSGAGPLGFLLIDAEDEHVLPDVPRVLAALRERGFELVGVGYHHPVRTFAELRPLLLKMARFWDTFVVTTSASLAAIPRAMFENLVLGGLYGYHYADWRVVAAPRCAGVVHVWPATGGVPTPVASILEGPALVSVLLTLRASPDLGLAEMIELVSVPEKAVCDDVSVLMQFQMIEDESELVVVAFVDG